MAVISTNPRIELIEQCSDIGEHEGFLITVSGQNFGLATYVEMSQRGDMGYNVESAVGNFETHDNDEHLIDVLISRISTASKFFTEKR